MVILAPIAAMLVQMAISRTREYAADRLGAQISGQPEWLASALAKLEQRRPRHPQRRRRAGPATAHLFIVNPLSGARMDNLFVIPTQTTYSGTFFITHGATKTRNPLREPAHATPLIGGPFAFRLSFQVQG